jgi:hypothetical protein
MASHLQGHELLEVQSYYLSVSRQVGLLADFRFRLKEGVSFDREVQRLSLSLDRNYRRNLDFYVDRREKIRGFLDKKWPVFSSIVLPGHENPLTVSKDFVELDARRLGPKTYVFGNGRQARSQFNGIREFGPLQRLPKELRLLFVFREQDRQSARILAATIRGNKRGQFSFPGFESLFKTELIIDPSPVVLPNLSSEQIERALERVEPEVARGSIVVPVVVMPEGQDDEYFAQKSMFAHAGVATQVCTLGILRDDNALRWAISNIALQVFCKAGGIPWRVRPTVERSLIIGVSQSHKSRELNNEVIVEKYFAFSVITDGSGTFQRIQVLGEERDRGNYLDSLRSNLKKIVEDGSRSYNRIVIHTSFKLKYDEIDAIRDAVETVAGSSDERRCSFAVIKVNQHSRFFGFNPQANSLVPFEASTVRLGRGEHLIWFEGIFPDNPKVTKAFPGPVHLQFLRLDKSHIDGAEEREMLQDVVNLSGANWRGFNARSIPVSIHYCHLVANLVHEFNLRDLPMPAVEDLRPWFL